jgi:hypothetical protein
MKNSDGFKGLFVRLVVDASGWRVARNDYLGGVRHSGLACGANGAYCEGLHVRDVGGAHDVLDDEDNDGHDYGKHHQSANHQESH